MEWLSANVEVVVLLVLVLVTGYYAIQTRNTVRAMEASTRAQQMPRLVMQVASMPPSGRSDSSQSAVWVWNDGAGPAIDAFLTVRFIPPRGTNLPEHKQDLRVSVIAGDVLVEVDGPTDSEGEVVSAERMCQDYDAIRLEGQMLDSLGQRHDVRQELKDLRALALRKDAGYRLKHERTLTALSKLGMHLFAIKLELSKVGKELAQLREGDNPPPPADDDVPF